MKMSIKYSNSPLVDVVLLSPNYSAGRVSSSLNPTGIVDKITIHHMAGNLTVESCGRWFMKTAAQASANYGVGSDGRIGLYVEEKNRSWASASKANDLRAVTIEVANDGGSPTNWHVSDAALASTIKLCIDICQRNAIKEINFVGNSSGNLTMHKYFVATTCPGPYLESKFPYIMEQINLGLNATVETPDDSTKEEQVVSKMAGKSVVLEDCNLYSTSTSTRRHTTVSGTYFVWSDEIISNRVKITNNESLVGVKGQVTGWVNYSDIQSQVEGPKVDETVIPPVTPEVVEDVPKWMWDFLKSKGLNDFAIAGVMGNLAAESNLKSTNLQNSYEDDFGHSDESYTAAVDAGVYADFVNDKAGYGFAQWTFWSRKEGLLNFAKSEGKSIGSPSMQMDFFWKELSESYSKVLSALKSVTSVREASDIVLKQYEAPANANQSESIQKRRADMGQKYYDKYATPVIETPKEEPKTEVEPDKNFTPYFAKVEIDDLRIRKGPGTNYESCGFTGKGTFTIVDESNGPGATKWGLLKSCQSRRDGWISLDYAKKISSPATISKGDQVKIISSAQKWLTGQNIPNWVKLRTLYVRSDVSEKGTCQVSTLKSGDITGVIEVKYLQKV